MNLISKVMIGLTMLACLVALAASVYPGMLGDLLFMAALLSFFVVPVVGIAVFAGSMVVARRHKLRIRAVFGERRSDCRGDPHRHTHPADVLRATADRLCPLAIIVRATGPQCAGLQRTTGRR